MAALPKFGMFVVVLVIGIATAARAQTNFVVIIADDMAWNDAGAYGHPTIRTPNIDRLASG